MFYIDLETTCDGGPDGNSPEAHWKNNRVLLCGWRENGGKIVVNTSVNSFCDAIIQYLDSFSEEKQVYLAGHNIKFDLKYLMRDRPDVPWHKVRIWCTMTAEYLITGHQAKFISLEDLCAKYRIPFKKTIDLGALLKSGVKMQDIPIERLTAYLIDDVKVLREVYHAQEGRDVVDMDYILPLCEMELNGLPIDRDEAKQKLTALTKVVDSSVDYFVKYICTHCEWQDGTRIEYPEDFISQLGTKSKTIKPMANRTLSFLLFGEPGRLHITPKWQVHFKTHSRPILTQPEVKTLYPDTKPSAQGYPTGEDALNNALLLYPSISPLVTPLLEHRKANKLLGTYISPFLATSALQGNIYPKLNTTVTNTGRLSSSDPNGQNVPPEARSLVKAEKGNKIVEVDFKQLEMVGAAAESEDPVMIKDLNSGEDLHFNTGQTVMGWKTPADMTKEQRTLVKNVNFGVLYGGKAPGLSAQTGVDQTIIKKLIDAFYSRYPRVQAWQREVYESVVNNMATYDIKDGEQRYASMFTLPISGRKFLFVENDSPAWLRAKTGRKFSFSPQHTANYPIQGFAGGDVVMSALYFLWVAIHSTGASEFVKFRMTVHDSILLEVKDGINLTHVLQMMCDHVKDKYNLPVDLNVDVEIDGYWH